MLTYSKSLSYTHLHPWPRSSDPHNLWLTTYQRGNYFTFLLYFIYIVSYQKLFSNLTVPSVYAFIFMLVLYVLITINFYIIWNQKACLQFCCSQRCVVIWGLLRFHTNFRIVCSIYVKNAIIVLIESVLNL